MTNSIMDGDEYAWVDLKILKEVVLNVSWRAITLLTTTVGFSSATASWRAGSRPIAERPYPAQP
jgi:hypothetical protein